MTVLRSIIAAALCLAALAGAAAAEDTVRIGLARSVSNGAELIAIEKGYFKDVGIKVEIDDIDTSANTIANLQPFTNANNDVLWECGKSGTPSGATSTAPTGTNTLLAQYLPTACHS